MKTLFVLAGFSGDVNRPLAQLRRIFNSDAADFIGRGYPERRDKRSNYPIEVARDIVGYVFGKEGATGFCRRMDQPCARQPGKGPRRCDVARGTLACYRERPRMIVVISHAGTREVFLEHLGRACLILTEAAPAHVEVKTIAERVRSSLPLIEEIADYLYNIRLNHLTPWLPMANFQKISGNSIAADAQSNLASFRATMEGYHQKLYDPGYANPKKRYMKGAYKLNKRIGFQRDLLHDFAQIAASDAVHLINAHHFYGAAFPVGYHFDVTAEDGGSLNQVFMDMVTGNPSDRGSLKEDITPCDRVLGAL